MYEELVMRLREAPNDWPDADLHYEAADAIESLSKDLESSKDYESFWRQEAEEALRRFQVAVASKPQWIPVTERLPEELGRYLCRYRVEDNETIGYCTDFGRYDPEHGEWYANTVTHWMPLPEPPKEEH